MSAFNCFIVAIGLSIMFWDVIEVQIRICKRKRAFFKKYGRPGDPIR